MHPPRRIKHFHWRHLLITLVVGMAGTAFASTEENKKRGKKHKPAQRAGEPSRPFPPAPAPKAPAPAKPKGDGKAKSGITSAMEDWVRNLPAGGNEAMLRLLGLAPPPAAPASSAPAPDPPARAAADLRAAAIQGLRRKLDANPGHKDFNGLDLAGSDLDLSGRVLSDADFRGSRLASVRFRDARLKHARFFEADIRGAVDLDLSEAELHPFFQADPGDPVGQIKTLRLPDLGPDGADLPGRLAMTRNRAAVARLPGPVGG